MTGIPVKDPKDTATDTDPASARMMQFITGSFVSQVVRAFAEFHIAEWLDAQPATAPQIAAAIGAHAEATMRLLRAGTALGLVNVDDQARFVSTPLLQTLRGNAPGSLRGLAIALASPGTWLPWGNLVAAVRTGQRQTVAIHGMEYFEYLRSASCRGRDLHCGHGWCHRLPCRTSCNDYRDAINGRGGRYWRSLGYSSSRSACCEPATPRHRL